MNACMKTHKHHIQFLFNAVEMPDSEGKERERKRPTKRQTDIQTDRQGAGARARTHTKGE